MTKETRAQALYCMGGVYKNQRDMHSAANFYEQVTHVLEFQDRPNRISSSQAEGGFGSDGSPPSGVGGTQ